VAAATDLDYHAALRKEAMQLETGAAVVSPIVREISPSTYLELAKARLSALVVVTAIVGFLVAARGTIDFVTLLATTLGTALAAGGANGLNQVLEAGRDALMERTKTRPLPSGRMTPRHALLASGALAATGVGILLAIVGPLPAALCATALALYVLVYTPLKTRSTLCTLVGAVVGAIPPMIGWSAASGSLDVGAWLLAGILFVWQIPHFLALAWLYREDYERGGFRMLPLVDPAGRTTCWMALLYSLALIPLGLAVSATGLAGTPFAVGSALLGAAMVLASAWLLARRRRVDARRVFLASLVYLPALLILMVVG